MELYIQKSVSENAGIAVIIWGRKIQNFLGENTCDTTPKFLLPTTIYHFSTLGIVWSLFVVAPPTDELLKNALAITRQFDGDNSFFKLLIERTTLPEYDGVCFIWI